MSKREQQSKYFEQKAKRDDHVRRIAELRAELKAGIESHRQRYEALPETLEAKPASKVEMKEFAETAQAIVWNQAQMRATEKKMYATSAGILGAEDAEKEIAEIETKKAKKAQGKQQEEEAKKAEWREKYAKDKTRGRSEADLIKAGIKQAPPKPQKGSDSPE